MNGDLTLTTANTLRGWLDTNDHTGDVPQRVFALAADVRRALKGGPET